MRRCAAILLVLAAGILSYPPLSGSQDPVPDAAPAVPPVVEAEDGPKAQPEPAAPAVSSAAASLTTRGPVTALVSSLDTAPIDFNFKDADLLGILRSFAVKFNKNIIAAAGVGGRVNMQLRAVPFDEAFRTLLDHMGLVAIQKSANVIEIIRTENMPVMTEVFPLKYRFAGDVAPTLLGMLDVKEKVGTVISVDNPSNSLIVTSTNDILRKMKLMVEQLDITAPQIAIKARLIEVQGSNLANWGITWTGSSQFEKNGQVRFTKDQNNYTIPAADNLVTGEKATQNNFNNTATFFPLGGILEISSIMNRTRLFALLNMIQSDTKSKTISEPMVLTGNNKTAKIHVGQNLPVKTSQVTQTGTTQSVQYIPEGVDLDVTPIVSPGSDVISFKIRVGVSELVGFQSDSPITTERTALTEVSIPSGMTVVIGGLIKDRDLNVDSGIPILKDIPLLGWLFKTKRKSKERTELLIFITPELQVPVR